MELNQVDLERQINKLIAKRKRKQTHQNSILQANSISPFNSSDSEAEDMQEEEIEIPQEPTDEHALEEEEISTLIPTEELIVAEEAQPREKAAEDEAKTEKATEEEAEKPELESMTISTEFHGLVIVVYNFQNVDSISDAVRPAAVALHAALSDIKFGGFNRKTTKLLTNPSVVEFQDAIEQYQDLPPTSSFFLFIASHGVRIEGGKNDGSYILMRESRVTTESELLLTSIKETQLADYLNAIPAQNQLIALEICQKSALFKKNETTIQGRIDSNYLDKLHTAVHSHSPDKNYIFLESCNCRTEEPLADDRGWSNFIVRLTDAFRGACADPGEHDQFQHWHERDDLLPYLYAQQLCEYVVKFVQLDASVQHEKRIKENELDVVSNNKFEAAAISKNLTHTPSWRATGISSFTIANAPRIPPKLEPPVLVQASRTSISLRWEGPRDYLGSPIIGFMIEKAGADRAAKDTWALAGVKMVYSYQNVVHEEMKVPFNGFFQGFHADCNYIFRIRARNCGGWGEFSDPSVPIRTQAVVPSSSILDDVQRIGGGAASRFRSNPQALVELMQKRSECSLVQAYGCEELAKMALEYKILCLHAKKVFDVSQLVATISKALQKFDQDYRLQRAGASVITRLAQHDELRQSIAIDCRKTGLKKHWANLLPKLSPIDFLVTEAITTCVKMLKKAPSKRKYGKNEAAMKIQNLFRNKCSSSYRYFDAFLGQFEQAIDPDTGMVYYYNPQTGEAQWDPPT